MSRTPIDLVTDQLIEGAEILVLARTLREAEAFFDRVLADIESFDRESRALGVDGDVRRVQRSSGRKTIETQLGGRLRAGSSRGDFFRGMRPDVVVLVERPYPTEEGSIYPLLASGNAALVDISTFWSRARGGAA